MKKYIYGITIFAFSILFSMEESSLESLKTFIEEGNPEGFAWAISRTRPFENDQLNLNTLNKKQLENKNSELSLLRNKLQKTRTTNNRIMSPLTGLAMITGGGSIVSLSRQLRTASDDDGNESYGSFMRTIPLLFSSTLIVHQAVLWILERRVRTIKKQIIEEEKSLKESQAIQCVLNAISGNPLSESSSQSESIIPILN